MRFDDVRKIVDALTAPLKRRVMLMVGRAILTAVDDGMKSQSVQVHVRADEIRDGVERFQEFGFSSVPPTGTEAVVVFVGGNTAHGIVVATESRDYRPTGLNEGEVVLYTKQDGKRVYCKDDGTIELGTSPSDFVALASLVEQDLTTLKNAISNAATTPQDGGASFKAAIVAALATWPSSLGAEEVKAK